MPLKNGTVQHQLTEEEARKGGINSGKVRAEKKTIQQILNGFMEQEIKEYPQVKNIANKLGLKTDQSIKDLFTIVCTLNTLKQGKIDDLLKLSDLLGETKKAENTDILDKLDTVIGEVDTLAK